jgi:hypothetical protein
MNQGGFLTDLGMPLRQGRRRRGWLEPIRKRPKKEGGGRPQEGGGLGVDTGLFGMGPAQLVQRRCSLGFHGILRGRVGEGVPVLRVPSRGPEGCKMRAWVESDGWRSSGGESTWGRRKNAHSHPETQEMALQEGLARPARRWDGDGGRWERDDRALVPERNLHMRWLGLCPNDCLCGSLVRARGIFITLLVSRVICS